MTIQQAYRQLQAQLYDLYDNREAANISDWVIEYVTGQQKMHRIINKELRLTLQQEEQLRNMTGELLNHKPVQYVLNEAWFAGMKLFVNEHVLIPRPETEELVDWIVNDRQKNRELFEKNTPCSMLNAQCSILDVGTGSGCIAIALKSKLPYANLYAVDILYEALSVAERNAKEQNAPIEFIHLDILKEEEWHRLPTFDLIVSNPPYVKLSEAGSMNKNVIKYEPHTALFVADEDALVFYRALAKLGTEHLTQNGFLYTEINEALWENVVSLYKDEGYKSVELKKDMQGKDRMVKAQFNHC